MVDLQDVINKLKAGADQSKLEGMAKYKMAGSKRMGVSVPYMRKLAKEIGRDHSLALDLWKTGIPEAMITASMIADPEILTESQMDEWVQDFNSWDVCDQVCMNLFDKSPLAWKKVFDWAVREEEFVKRAGYALIACLAWHDKTAGDDQFTQYFPVIISGADDSRNFVKKGVSWALRHIGKRNPELNGQALLVAQELSQHESKTAQWIATDAIKDMTSDSTRRKMEKMRNL